MAEGAAAAAAAAAAEAMQEALSCPAHPVALGFGPVPLGFGDPRLCSPSLLLPVADVYGGGYSPMASPHGYSLYAANSMSYPRGDGLFHGGGYTSAMASPQGYSFYAANPMAYPRGDGLFHGGGGYTFYAPNPMALPCGDYLFHGGGYTASTTMASARGAASPSNPSSSASHTTQDAAAAAASDLLLYTAQQFQEAAREAAALRLELSELRSLNIGQMQAMPAPPMPRPASLTAPAPRPASLTAPAPRPASLTAPAPRPASLTAPAPRPASLTAPAPRPASLTAPMPRPASQPVPRPASPAEKLAVLPKSISIRSSGYTKLTRNVKHRVTNAKPEEGKAVGLVELDFDAYSQGMLKTELCNKWEEAGACAYGDKCQFAHSIAELRPVIRHPRYKTRLCSLPVCSYGHRCHFRHPVDTDHK